MKYLQKPYSSAAYHNMTVVLFTLSCVLICGSLSIKAQTKTSDEQVTPETVPGRNGKIAFTTGSICTTEADGGNVQRLTDSPSYEYSPRWSPDGTKIVFVSKRDNNDEIYVMNADGSNQTRLTNNLADDYSPIFSPDGTRIAFGSRRDNNDEIYVMNADGSNQTRLTNDPAGDYSLVWSPDGSRIAFARDGHIYVMGADGANQTRLTTGGSDGSPRWSPDGTKIAFQRFGTLYNNSEIFVMNADGSNQTRLANEASSDGSLDWSPDGSRIAFAGSPDNFLNNYEIYVINADGSNQTRLTNNSAYDHSPIFSPDGTRIAFLSDRDKIDNGWDYNNKIYVMNADGSSQTRLTNTADEVYEEGALDWQVLPQAAVNPIDTVDFLVRQHYRDFLSREPDTPGLAFWTNEITSCGGDAQCAEVKRINVSAAFFLSTEFQETGYLVYKTYAAAFGPTRIASTVPLTRSEFLPDVQSVAQGVVVLATGWQEQLEANQTAYFNEFVQRPNFVATYPPTMSSAQYVDALNANASAALSISERDQLVNELTNGVKTRAQVLRAVVHDADFTRAHFNRAFVLMQYFGYLRRNPNEPPDNNFNGYNFWLAKLDQFNGNFIEAEMVKAFITSVEYRQRFGP
jgi:Tol biopolymer transport system component